MGGLLCAAWTFESRASGFSMVPDDGVVLFVAAMPALAGAIVGAFAGFRGWRLWKSLGAGGAMALGCLLLVFMRDRWVFFAAVAIPLLAGIYLFFHATCQLACARWRRRSVRVDTSLDA